MSEGSFHQRFTEHIGRLVGEAGQARAVLRRSLAFAPGTWSAAFPFVEPFVATSKEPIRRAAYLVAGLNAISGVQVGNGNMGAAAYRLLAKTDSDSVEKRFLNLLDADSDQLPHRLRQMITLMAGHEIAPDWTVLFRDVTNWNHPDRFVQERWARKYYENEANRGSRTDDEATDGNTKDAQSNEDLAVED